MESTNAVKIVNPEVFRVPYAITEDDRSFDIKDLIEKREVPDEKFICPVCEERVFFVRETDQRSAHFRHQTTSTCDRIAAERAQTIHDRVVQITARMIQNGVALAQICTGHKGLKQELPTGQVCIEKSYTMQGQRYQPDISILPQDGQIAPTFELEVVLTHRPEKDRLKLAAQNGRVVACLSIGKLQQYFDTAKRLEARTGRAFDFDKMCHDYVVTNKFSILQDKDVKQGLRAFISAKREYLRAQKAEQHRQSPTTAHKTPHTPSPYVAPAEPPIVRPAPPLPVDAVYGTSANGNPLTWSGKVVSRQAWGKLTDWQKHGPNGRVWNGKTRRWEAA